MLQQSSFGVESRIFRDDHEVVNRIQAKAYSIELFVHWQFNWKSQCESLRTKLVKHRLAAVFVEKAIGTGRQRPISHPAQGTL
jgi:hypothetical protein